MDVKIERLIGGGGMGGGDDADDGNFPLLLPVMQILLMAAV
jgi:hypothetical protein